MTIAPDYDEIAALEAEMTGQAGPETDHPVWGQRPILGHICDFARARRAGPWAVLGVVLARAIATVEPTVMIPPTVGSAVSLNSFCALVGPSGGGKGAAEGTARDAVRFLDHNGRDIELEEFPVGSGEGLPRTFRSANTDDDEGNGRTRALFTAPEVDTLTALGGRKGSTLMPELRKLYMGEQLGFQNASTATRSVIAGHSYRACLIVGVQPAKAGPLIADADGGTPQRFLWMPVSDPDAPDTAPPAPQPWQIMHPKWGSARVELEIPDSARRAIDAHRLSTLRGEMSNALDGHALLCREKVAAALMILDGRTIMSEEDWTIAGRIVAVSDRTRAGIERTLAERNRDANRARAEAKADEADTLADRADARVRARARDAVVRRLDRRGDATRKELRSAMRNDIRGELDATLADLIDEHIICESAGVYALAEGYGGTNRTPTKNTV